MNARIVALGDAALLLQLGDEIDLELNRRVHALDALLHRHAAEGIIETVPAYASLTVHYDPLVLTYGQVSDWVKAAVERVEASAARPARRLEVPVRYGGAAGPDLDWVASYHQLSPAEVIRLHTGTIYTVYMMGFTPGFPYLGRLPPSLVTPRLSSPRARVAAGSVAVAGEQTGIYPVDSPGGWRLIGWTPMRLFDPSGDAPFLFAPGDEVRFIAEAVDA